MTSAGLMLRVTDTSKGLTVWAPAKVNLTLRVLGTRPDGFHELESVAALVDFCDRLHVAEAEDLSLTCGGEAVPADETNLVLRAARALQETVGTRRGARLHLEKRIPPGRGLGGGSSDAAAALVGLDALWGCGLDAEALAEVGARVGSDVPLFFAGPLAVLRGRGERVERVEGPRPSWRLVLAWPDYGLSTAAVYAAYDRLGSAPGQDGPPATAILEHLQAPAREVKSFLVNDLERPADNLRKDRLHVGLLLRQAGAEAVGMSGSGSAYFALADTEDEARRWARRVRAAGASARAVRLLGNGIEQQENTS